MLTHEATRSEIEEWKRIFEEYRGKIRPCRRSGEELAAYLKKRYSAVRTDDREILAATAGNVLENECYREKLPEGKEPRAEVFRLFWRGGEVFVGLEAETGALWNLPLFRPTNMRIYTTKFSFFVAWTKRISKTFFSWRNT